MQGSTEADGTLVLTHDSAGWARLLFALAALAIATAGYDYFIGARGTDRLIALLAAVVMFGVAGVVMLEHAQVRVSPRTRTITWARRWLFKRQSGTVSFDDVKSILPERSIADRRIPSRRIVLRTTDGRMIPFTIGYGTDGPGHIPKLADEVRRVVGLPDESPAARLRSFIEAGRPIDAVKYLEETQGLSTRDAQREVKAVRATFRSRP